MGIGSTPQTSRHPDRPRLMRTRPTARRRTKPSPWQERTKIERTLCSSPEAELWTRLPRSAIGNTTPAPRPGAPIPSMAGLGCTADGCPTSREDDELAGRRSVFHVGMRSTDLVERVRAVAGDGEAAGRDRVEVGLEDVGGKVGGVAAIRGEPHARREVVD